MENPQNPDFQIYPPPQSWLSPPASWLEPQPTWMDPPSGSSSDHVPLWVIVGLVAAILIFLFFIFMYIKKRWAHKKDESPPLSGPVVKKLVTAPTMIKEEVVQGRPPQHHHDCEHSVGMPQDCPSCGRSSGLYHLSYKCPKCIYKHEVGIHIQYPTKK